MAAGDTVYLRAGSYNIQLAPAHSGTDVAHRISFTASPGETPTFTTGGTDLELSGKSYIRISGITFAETAFVTTVRIEEGSSHNEIDHNTFTNTGLPKMLLWLSGAHSSGCPSACKWNTNNWIHDNSFLESGKANGGDGCTDDGWDNVKLGEYNAANSSEDDNYNTIENNIFAHGGHSTLSNFGRFVVIRNNVMHNEPWSEGCPTSTYSQYSGSNPNYASYAGFYGHRDLDMEDWYGRFMYDLIEGNRLGYASPNPSNDGADGISLGTSQNIVRYNFIYATMNPGILLKYDFAKNSSNGYGGTYGRIYNNTLYQMGYGYPMGQNGAIYGPWPQSAISLYCSASGSNCGGNSSALGDVLKNNLFRLSAGYTARSADVQTKSGPANGWNEFSAANIGNNWCTGTQTSNGGCSASGDPLFTNPDLSNPASATLPDLSLQSGSAAIDGGTWLTTATNSGSNAISLTVADAMYFQDGTWGSDLARVSSGLGGTMQPDWIAIGSVTNTVGISAISYGAYNSPAGTITLASPMTWNNGAHIWLYKKSDGTVVLNGVAPDYGASEHGTSGASIAPPSALKATAN